MSEAASAGSEATAQPSSSATYDAFISYSHTSDADLAKQTQIGLQRLAKPWYGRRALHVFRDATGLGVSPHLWESICSALDSSRYFVFMASPESAASEWVGRELGRWLGAQPADRILIVLTDGTIEWVDDRSDFDWERSDALHPVLRDVFESEPLYLDLRWARSAPELTVRDPRFRREMAELAAPIHGKPPDELESDDLREQQKLRRATRGGVSVLVLLLVVALVTSVIAFQQRSEARHSARVSQARALSAEVLNQQQAGRSGLGLLLAAESNRVDSGLASQRALLSALESPPGLYRDVGMHSGVVGSVAFSRDGSLVATPDGNRVRLVRVGTGLPAGSIRLRGPNTIGPLAFTDGDRLLVALHFTATSEDLAAWNVHTGAAVPNQGSPRGVASWVASSGAPRVATLGDTDGSVEVWDPRSWSLLQRLPINIPFASDESVQLALDPDGTTLAVVRIAPRSDGAKDYVETVDAWDLADGARTFACSADVGGLFDGRYRMYPDAPQVLDAAVAVGGRSVVTHASGGTRAIFGECTGGSSVLNVATVSLPTVGTSPVAAISHDGSIIATRDTLSGAVTFYRTPTADSTDVVEARQRIVEPPLSTYEFASVVFSPDDRFVTLPTSSVGELQIWRLALTPDPLARPVHVPDGDRLLSVAPDAKTFLVETPSGAQSVVERSTGRRLGFQLPAPRSGTDDCAVVSPVEFVGSGDHVAAVAYDRRCRPQSIVLSDLDGSHRRVLRVPRCAWTGSFGVSTNGHLLVAGCMRDTSTASVPLIARLDIGKRRPRLISVDRVDIRPDQITVDADGQGVVIGEADRAGGAFQSLSFRGGHVLRGEVDHANGNFIGSAAFAPNGTTFATGFSDGRLRLWESSADGLRAVDLTENGPTGVTSLAFSPDGGELLVGDAAGGVRLWDIATRSLIGTITQRAQGVGALAFDGTDRRVVAVSSAPLDQGTGDSRGAGFSIAFDESTLVRASCNIVGRSLSASERAIRAERRQRSDVSSLTRPVGDYPDSFTVWIGTSR